VRKSILQPQFFEDLEYWVSHDKKMTKRLFRIMKETLRDPFGGIGKPEPLKSLGGDIWAKRLTDQHRIVYRVYDDTIDFLQARYHYDDH